MKRRLAGSAILLYAWAWVVLLVAGDVGIIFALPAILVGLWFAWRAMREG